MILLTPDANVLASGITHEHTPPGRLLGEWSAGRIQFVVSEPLLKEVQQALAKPYFQRLRPIDVLTREIAALSTGSVMVEVSRSVQGVATHPEDDVILATALSGSAAFLVTGDHDLLRLGSYEGVTIVTVRAFLAMLPGLRADELKG